MIQMRKGDLIQSLSLFGFKYARILTRHITREAAEGLKKKYHYIHIYSFEKENLPGYDVKTQRTPIFDLSEDLGGIFRKFNDTCKKHIRRGERNADLTLAVPDNNVDASYALYKRIKNQEGARPDIKREFKNNLFSNAYVNGEMIVTMSFYDNGEVTRAKHIASLRKEMGEDAKIVAHASRRLNWEVIKWGKANGRKFFDLGGVTDDWDKAGIREFKKSFGGTEVDMHIYRYTTPFFAFLKKILNMFGKNIN